MALIFCDSFDHYAAADYLSKWTLDGTQGLALTAAAGRNGTAAAVFTHGFAYLQKNFAAGMATVIVGMAAKTLSPTDTNNRLISFYDGSNLHVDLRTDATGHLVATRNGTTLGTGTKILATSVFYYIEMKVTIDDTAGVVVVKVDGVTDINLSSQDTRNAGNASVDAVRLNGGSVNQNATTWYIDDLYICDTSGSTNNDFLGDVRVEAILPNGDGTTSNLVGSDGNSVNNSLLVDEAAPNGDTDYVESSTVNDKDTYAYGNLTSTSGTVFGVQVLPYARKTDAGTRSIVSVARVSATEVDSATKTLSTSYQYLPDIRETKPGGGAWTISDVNSAEFGVKVTA